MITEKLDQLENTAIDLVAKIAPWAAPLPTAYLVGAATIRHLHWPAIVGVVAAVIIESLGLATTSTALTLRDYNASKRKSDPQAPFTLAVALVAVYFVTAVGLTVALDILPGLAVYSPGVFPFLSLAGVTVLALRSDHRRRVEEIEADKEKRSRQRSQRRSSKRSKSVQVHGQTVGQSNGKVNASEQAETVNLDNLNKANQARRLNREQALNALVEFFERRPDGSYSQAGRSVGRSKSWVSGAVSDLEDEGQLRRNGNGIEILEG